jgi:acylphosphatase
MLRVSVHYRGRVQGVGFRATVRDIARHHAVAGYVMNLPDGSVRLVAEGSREEVQALLADVRRAMSRHIKDEARAESIATGEWGRPAPGALVIRY